MLFLKQEKVRKTEGRNRLSHEKGVIIMKKMNVLDWVVLVLVVVGGLNWGFVGFFDYNVVAHIFGDMTMVTRVIYDLVGLAALYKIYHVFTWMRAEK